MLLSSFYKFVKVLKYPSKIFSENTTSQNIALNLVPLFLQHYKKQLLIRLQNTQNGRTPKDAPLGNMPLNMEMLQQFAILRDIFQSLKKSQSESSKTSMKNNYKR